MPPCVKAPAQRIVTMAPFLTELVFSAGAGDRVVGVSAHSDYPPEARGLPEVGSAVAFSIEPIAAMRPDLALVWKDSVRSEDLKRLEAFGQSRFRIVGGDDDRNGRIGHGTYAAAWAACLLSASTSASREACSLSSAATGTSRALSEATSNSSW